ncbi:uncharacterized protein LOC134821238 [Bolinopsis microptera]|uniref:uncharacterized protein LOC134821238 n=1 Tax=Bolinopsis microptera TaxID=2820187 RepID=UPI003078EDC0
MHTQTFLFALLLSACCLFYMGESKLSCYHCTKQITDKTTTSYMEYNTGTQASECAEKECSDDTDECFSLTTTASSEGETSVSVHMSCGTTTKDEACTEVGGLNVATCKSDWTWKICKKDLCNSGSAFQPMLILMALTIVAALFSY